MSTPDTLTTLFGHNRWANLQLLERCSGMTEQQLDGTVLGTYGSIRDTLQHIATAERSYLSRISTGRPYRRPENAPPPTFAELAESLDASGSGLIEWAAKVHADDTVEVEWEGTPRHLPKTILLTQAINHATEHRSQIMAIMTQVGVPPPELDGWTYFEGLEPQERS